MQITIVGAGIFGLAAALELHRRGHKVTVCEQEQVPCERASSTDVSKIIRRTNYLEDTYVELVESRHINGASGTSSSAGPSISRPACSCSCAILPATAAYTAAGKALPSGKTASVSFR